MSGRRPEIALDVALAADAWAKQEGWRDMAACRAHPLAAFSAGADYQRERIAAALGDLTAYRTDAELRAALETVIGNLAPVATGNPPGPEDDQDTPVRAAAARARAGIEAP